MGFPIDRGEAVLSVLRGFERYLVDVRSDTEPARTCFHLSGLPALWFVNDYGKLPIHTAQDTIDLVSPDELAYSAEAIAAVVAHLSEDLGKS